MLYVVIALKSEAQAFVDKYKFNKSKVDDFILYTNDKIKIIISGIGALNAKSATEKLIEHFHPSAHDTFLNIGICGASRNYKIGELIQIGTIMYDNEKFTLDKNIPTLINCVNTEIYEHLYDIVDMESFGFYSAVKNMKNVYMYKIVSDNFEPEKVTKDKTKSLIFSVLDEVIKKVDNGI